MKIKRILAVAMVGAALIAGALAGTASANKDWSAGHHEGGVAPAGHHEGGFVVAGD